MVSVNRTILTSWTRPLPGRATLRHTWHPRMGPAEGTSTHSWRTTARSSETTTVTSRSPVCSGPMRTTRVEAAQPASSIAEPASMTIGSGRMPEAERKARATPGAPTSAAT